MMAPMSPRLMISPAPFADRCGGLGKFFGARFCGLVSLGLDMAFVPGLGYMTVFSSKRSLYLKQGARVYPKVGRQLYCLSKFLGDKMDQFAIVLHCIS